MQTSPKDLEHKLAAMRNSMDTLSMMIDTTEREHAEALRRESVLSVQQILASLTYKTETANGIVCRGPFGSFVSSCREYNIGCTTLPMSIYMKARVCNLTEYIRGVFYAPGDNVFQKVQNFLNDRWSDLRTYDLYTLPIDIVAREAGKKRVDIPNVNYAITTLFLQMLPDHDFVVSDPVYKGTDPSVRITNYSHVYRRLREMRVRVQTFKNASSDLSKGLDVVLYQRGDGNPDIKSTKAINLATGLKPSDIVHIHLVPGKETVGLMGGNCYKDFSKSAALILHELSIIDEFCRKHAKPFVNNINFVLDPFSGYAAFTAVAVLGYGVQDMTRILAGRYINGTLTYTPIP